MYFTPFIFINNLIYKSKGSLNMKNSQVRISSFDPTFNTFTLSLCMIRFILVKKEINTYPVSEQKLHTFFK